jgi:hypothetical protein
MFAAAYLMTKYKSCRLDQPIPVDQPAAFVLMVLPAKNLMVLPRVLAQPVGLNEADFDFSDCATRVRAETYR